MTWRTHALGGLSALWILASAPGGLNAGSFAPCAAAAVAGALLPDLDAQRSKIQSLGIGGIHPFVPLSQMANRAWGHRGLLHSWIALAAVGAIAAGLAFWWGAGPSAALWLGYASHLALDACTPAGLPRSLSRRRSFAARFHILPPGLRIVTGSPEEDMVLALLVGCSLMLLLHLLATA